MQLFVETIKWMEREKLY